MICQLYSVMLFQIPQRYRFSSKSQLLILLRILVLCCFRYHKGTDFQANHNYRLPIQNSFRVVLDTTKVQIFKQITTRGSYSAQFLGCFRYHKGTDFQANHNKVLVILLISLVVLDTTKVQIFKQITTQADTLDMSRGLFQIPQRYRFSSKSQRGYKTVSY